MWKTKDRLYKDDDSAVLAVAPFVAAASKKRRLKELADMVNQDPSQKAFFDGIYRGACLWSI